jgi:hypothetical protein
LAHCCDNPHRVSGSSLGGAELLSAAGNIPTYSAFDTKKRVNLGTASGRSCGCGLQATFSPVSNEEHAAICVGPTPAAGLGASINLRED